MRERERERERERMRERDYDDTWRHCDDNIRRQTTVDRQKNTRQTDTDRLTGKDRKRK